MLSELQSALPLLQVEHLYLQILGLLPGLRDGAFFIRVQLLQLLLFAPESSIVSAYFPHSARVYRMLHEAITSWCR